ncbi:MAG TPA: hypothetical protein VFA32_22715 [Dehalococcoidia bacterium]|nr:hypothetical protein [Dehalococcoidia bacterium]
MPLASLVTAANVAEVTVGLTVVDRVRVPRPQGRPKQRPASLEPTRAMTARNSGRGCEDGGFNPRYPAGSGPTTGANLAAHRRPMRPAGLAGR